MSQSQASVGMLVLFVAFTACAQFDSGALGAFLTYLTEDLGLSSDDVGFINAVEYILLPLSALFMAWWMTVCNIKLVLSICLIGNMIGVALLMLAPALHPSPVSSNSTDITNVTGNVTYDRYIPNTTGNASNTSNTEEYSEKTLFITMVVSRGISGVCHSAIAIYGPVWVETYAPVTSTTAWMGAMQASSLLGIVIGYTIAGLTGIWELTMVINLIWFGLVFVGLLSVSTKYLHVDMKESEDLEPEPEIIKTKLESPSEGRSSTIGRARGRSRGVSVQGSYLAPATITEEIIINKAPTQEREDEFDPDPAVTSWVIFTFMGIAVSMLFFVSAGLQFWTTPYLTQVIEREAGRSSDSIKSIVTLTIVVISLTGPLSGIIIGGQLFDSIGGYRTLTGQIKCTFILWVIAAFVSLVGVLATSSDGFWPVAVLFWVFNALGAMLLPGSMGIMLAALNPAHRTLGSGISQAMINLLGMAGGAYIPGWVVACNLENENDECDYKKALETVQLAPYIGFSMLLLSMMYLGWRLQQRRMASKSTLANPFLGKGDA